MPPTYDTLQLVGGDEKIFAQWGLSLTSIRGRKRNQAADTWKCNIINTTIASEANNPTFPFESQIIVRVNRTSSTVLTSTVTQPVKNTFSAGTTKFIGKRVGQPMKGPPTGQTVTYEFQGAWYDLDNTFYQQSFAGTAFSNPTSNLIGELVLFTGFEGSYNLYNPVLPGNSFLLNISVGDQIQQIVQFLLDTYAAQGMAAPFQYTGRALTGGQIDLTTTNTAPGTVDATNSTFNFLSTGSLSATNKYYQNQVPATPSIDRTLFGVYYPSYIAKPMKCTDAIKKCLELYPRCNVWFDYTTFAADGKTPLPTLHVDIVDHMTPITLALFDGTNHKNISITKRDDLIPRAIVITYRINNTINGQQVVGYAIDKWGPNGNNSALDPYAGLRVIGELVELSGYNATVVLGHLDCELIQAVGGTQASKLAWWQSDRGGNVGAILDNRVRFVDGNGNPTTIPDAVDISTGLTYDASFYQCRIVRGTYHAWMSSGNNPVLAKKVHLKSQMQYQEFTAITNGVPVKGGNKHDQHCNMEVTNAPPGVTQYETLASLTPGEAFIVGVGGIAQYLYQNMSVMQYDGEFVKVQASFDDSTSSTFIHPGRSLNLSNGATQWLTMNAQIQEIEEDYGMHETSIRIGVAKHLNSGQLSSLLNMWRFRRPWYNPQVRASTTIPGGGTVDQAITTGNANTTEGLDDNNYHAVNAPFTPRTS